MDVTLIITQTNVIIFLMQNNNKSMQHC